MRDLRSDLENLWRASGRIDAAAGGRALMFIGVGEGVGTSSVATSFALLCADRSRKPSWLIDLDLMNNSLISAFEDEFAEGVGRPGRPYDASLGKMPFFDVSAPGQDEPKPDIRSGKLLAAHQIDGTKLLITRFRTERLAYGQKVRLSRRPEWWTALRKSADWISVDAPALETSRVGLNLVTNVDGVVLVVKGDETDVKTLSKTKQEIEIAGGHVLGVVMNQARKDSLFADNMTG